MKSPALNVVGRWCRSYLFYKEISSFFVFYTPEWVMFCPRHIFYPKNIIFLWETIREKSMFNFVRCLSRHVHVEAIFRSLEIFLRLENNVLHLIDCRSNKLLSKFQRRFYDFKKSVQEVVLEAVITKLDPLKNTQTHLYLHMCAYVWDYPRLYVCVI